MIITKDQMARDLVDKTGFYLKDIKVVLSAMDDLVKEYFGEVTDDKEVAVQIVEGVKISVHIVKPRQRKNPKTGEDIICSETVKPVAKFSDIFRQTIQKKYEENKNE
jgi:nucleoid DNA-binding protein